MLTGRSRAPHYHSNDANDAVQMRIQRIIAERFLPILDDVFVAHKTHILRTTAISGGVTCIAGILGSKSVELKASGETRARTLHATE